MSKVEKYIGDSLLKGEPKKEITLTVKDNAITNSKIADGQISFEKLDATLQNAILQGGGGEPQKIIGDYTTGSIPTMLYTQSGNYSAYFPSSVVGYLTLYPSESIEVNSSNSSSTIYIVDKVKKVNPVTGIEYDVILASGTGEATYQNNTDNIKEVKVALSTASTECSYTINTLGIPKEALRQDVQNTLDKADNAVDSVNGKTGIVVLNADDVGAYEKPNLDGQSTTGNMIINIQSTGMYPTSTNLTICPGETIKATFSDSITGYIVDVTSGDSTTYTILATDAGVVSYSNDTDDIKTICIASSSASEEYDYKLDTVGLPKEALRADVQEMLDKELEKNKFTFIIDIAKYGITEGLMKKSALTGHYFSSQYDAMYNNYIGFNQAFKDAIDAGVSKVIVPKGIYCFCPIDDGTRGVQIIQIYEADNIVFDFNSAIFKLCFDSTQRSQYHTYNSSTVYDVRASLLCVVASINIVIENLICIGDRTERSYIESGEKSQQGTRGICVGKLTDNIEIRNCDLSGFMACSISNADYKGQNMNLNRVNAGTFTNYGYYYTYDSNWTITKIDSASDEFFTISGFIDCNNVYTTAFKNLSKRVSSLAEKKIYALWHNSGYSHSIDCARYVSILTYETTDQELPSRIIRVEQLSNFQLEGNERYIRVQCSNEIDTPNPVEGEALSTTTHKMYIRYAQMGRTMIHHCNIHDDYLGAVSGMEGDMLICDNVFKKTYTENPPAYTIESTNFHFDGEDTNGETYTFLRNKFISLGGIGKLLFIYSPKRLVFAENHCDSGVSLGRHFEVTIANNYFGGSIGVGTFIAENGEYNVNGGRTLRRQIEVCGNIASGIDFSNTYLTDAKIYNNRFEVSSPISIGTLASQYRGGLNPKIEFVNNVIRLKSTSSVAVNPYSGRNNTIIADNVGNLGLPLWKNTTYDTGKLIPYTSSYIAQPVVYENLHITASGGSFVDIYGDITLRGCVFDSALWYALKIQRDAVITLENCIFNSTFFSVPANVDAINTLNGTCKFKFVNCTFNTDKLCTKFHGSFSVQIEATDCVAGVKEDTTLYQAMLSTSSGSSAYNKTLVSSSSGTTAERPNFPPLHYQYFDTTLGYPIYANTIDGTTGDMTWIDGAGNEI